MQWERVRVRVGKKTARRGSDVVLAHQRLADEEDARADLVQTHEIVWGVTLDPRNFHRKITGTPGFLEPTGESTVGDRGRPAQLYRRGQATALQPPMLRSSVA